MSKPEPAAPRQPTDAEWTFAWLARLAAIVGPEGEVSLSFGPVGDNGYREMGREKPWMLRVLGSKDTHDLAETGYGDTASEAALAYLAKLSEHAAEREATAAKQREHVAAFADRGAK